MRTKQEIEDEVDRAYDMISDGGSKWPGMSYEDGVIAALLWVLETNGDRPMDED